MDLAVRIGVAVVGVVLVAATLASAAQTLVVPRSTPVLITRWVFVVWGAVFDVARRADYRTRDRVLALYAPFALLTLPVVWRPWSGRGSPRSTSRSARAGATRCSRAARRCSPSASARRAASPPRCWCSSRRCSGSACSRC